MSGDVLSDFVEATAAELGIPGVAVGVWSNGREIYACHGVTSVENPLPIDQDTLFVLGSITKTYTATALMCLVASGQVELEAPVRRYIPELKLADEGATATITVLHLLNHTSGLGWDLLVDTGEGDDALAQFVAKLANLELIAPPGARASYSQAGYSLAGRILEKVTGTTYERAVASLVLEPLALSHTFFAPGDVMTRRFAVGHNLGDDGTLSIARLWKGPRCRNPGADIASSVADQLRWSRFHLGDGCSESGVRVLPTELLHQMREPTVELRGSTLGDALGIGWFLRDIDGHSDRRPRWVGERSVRGAADGTGTGLGCRCAVQRQPQWHPLQSSRRPLGAPDLRWGHRQRPGTDPVRGDAGARDPRDVRDRRHDPPHHKRRNGTKARSRNQAGDPCGIRD